jgi:hypothetical protein
MNPVILGGDRDLVVVGITGVGNRAVDLFVNVSA